MKIISLFLLHRDFADASHSKSPKSTAITVLYGIFSLENSYPSQQLKCNDNKFSCCENMRKQITKAETVTRVVKLDHRSFLDILKMKMYDA